MCNKMYENVKSLDYTKKSLQSDSDPATMEVVTRTNAVKSPTNSPETTKLVYTVCLLYTSPSPRDRTRSRMPSSA